MSSTPTPAASPLVKCENIEREYPDGHVVALREVNFEIARGEFLAIMGPSGSGKSTLLNLLGGLDRPTRGDISIDGVKLQTERQLDDLRVNKVGFIFQAFHLLPTLTACENVQVPMFEGPLGTAARRKKAMELLAKVGMSHRLDHLPTMLSAGERQRVAIARALANDPLMLLADEPTGNLDTATGEAILKLFEELHRDHNMTLIIVTHSPEVGERAHRLIRLRDGRIIEDRVRGQSEAIRSA
ncbi:MAG: ABC transporter ATP-binding protein [Gemmataceae bacterium]